MTSPTPSPVWARLLGLAVVVFLAGGVISFYTIFRPDYGARDGEIVLRLEEQIERPCDEVKTMTLTDLDLQVVPASCNRVGWTLEIEDGFSVPVRMETTNVLGGTYLVANLGIYGIAVHGGPDCEYWGTEGAISLMKKANFAPSDKHCDQ